MRTQRFIVLIIVVVIISLIIALLFARKTENLWDLNAPINSQRFSEFATFITGLFSILTIIFVYQAYQQSQHTSIENTFFNLLQGHQNIVSHLHQRITPQLRKEFDDLHRVFYNVGGDRDDRDFFELQYAKLNLTYKRPNTAMDMARIFEFFKEQNWVMGHYFRSFFSFIQWVDNHPNLSDQEKRWYVGFIEAQSSFDELRLLFYWAVTRDEPNRTHTCKLLNHYAFFQSVQKELIYADPDWNLFLSIIKQIS